MASNMLDFLQAASNAAASNLSGPVDGLTWLLRKAGVPVGDAPVGGSEWMKQKGLTRDVQPGLLSAVGETAGLLAPAVVAAKAPQVAAGLLRAGDNLTAPRAAGMVGDQRGALVIAPNKTNKEHLAKVMAEMESLGPPEVRVVWDEATGAYRALEGSHRLRAAQKLGLEPNLVEMVPKQWMGPHDFPDIREKASVARILSYLDGSNVIIDFPELPGKFGR